MAAAPAHTVVTARHATKALSYAREFLATAATLFQEVPLAGEICATFLAFEELVDTAKSNKEDLAVLRELCDVVIKIFFKRERRAEYSAWIEEAFQRLQKHMDGAREVAQLCNGRVKQILLGRKISRDIASVKQKLLDFSTTINVALTHELHVSSFRSPPLCCLLIPSRTYTIHRRAPTRQHDRRECGVRAWCSSQVQ